MELSDQQFFSKTMINKPGVLMGKKQMIIKEQIDYVGREIGVLRRNKKC